MGGLVGADTIVTVKDARRIARRRWPRLIFAFVDGTAGDGRGEELAQAALQDLRLEPRGLIDVEDRNLRVDLLGQTYDLPFGVAPMGMCELAWAGADLMLAQLAANEGMPLCVSTAASTSVEDIFAVAGANTWFQLYSDGDTENVDRLVERAGSCGCQVLILTVDVPQLARRPRELQAGFKHPFEFGARQIIDCALHPHWSLSRLLAGMPSPAHFSTSGPAQFKRYSGRGRLTFDYLERLRKQWPGKLVVKGVLSVQDALKIRDAGADAIYVSGHGGRQLDSTPPPVYALAAIRNALGADFPLIYDTGVRNGESILKALAAGANFVMLGRPFLYGIGAAGAKGLTTLNDALKFDLSCGLAQIGLSSIDQVSRDSLSWWQTAGCPENLRPTGN